MKNRYTPVEIIIADDHEIFRDGFKVMCSKEKTIHIVGEAENGEELVELVRKNPPDVVITDIKMPKMDGIAVARTLSKEFPQIGIIALSMFDEEDLVVEMLEAGAKGYLIKNAQKQEIFDAIDAVSKNENYYCNQTSAKLAGMIAASRFDSRKKKENIDFTGKELQIIQMICEEHSSREIADKLFLGVRTVEGYREKIQQKMNARNMAGVVVFAMRNGLYKHNKSS
jgi:DNA-binding NarL/FixJ family response regulator